MYLELSDIAVFALLTFVAMIWWHGFTLRQVALSHASRFCKQRNLQLLDQGIALSYGGFKRNHNGHLSILRQCRFEFSATGDDRYKGEVIMLGRIMIDIKTPPYVMPFTDDSDLI